MRTRSEANTADESVTNASDVIATATISTVWEGLGGGPLRFGRGRAFWRDGRNFNVALDDAKGVWYDFARSEGGGVIDLVQRAINYDRREALRWLADHVGVSLDDRPLSRDERQSFARRRQRAELVAKGLTAWRARHLADLRARRNACWDAERRASAWAREHINDPAMAEDWPWEAVWAHALDNQRGDELDSLVERIESATPNELVGMRRKREGLAA